MRWPIQTQLLLPMLLLIVAALSIASIAGGYFGSRQARQQQEDHLRRVVTTLTDANFPITQRVLQQMSGLSGAEFVLLDDHNGATASTLPLPPAELATVAVLPPETEPRPIAASPVVNVANRSYLARRVPLARPSSSREAASLVVLYREDRWREIARQASYPALVAGAVAAAAAVVVASVLARRFVRPLKTLGDETAKLPGGEFAGVSVPPRDDEIRDLALCINSMAAALRRYEEEVRRNERLATLGQLGAGIAHQLRNSATGARLDIELHQRECPAHDAAEPPLGVALRQLRIMESYLQRFLSLGKPRAAALAPISIADALDGAVELVRPAFAHHEVAITSRCEERTLRVLADRDALHDVLTNLLLNALEAARRNKTAAPRVLATIVPDGAGRVAIRISDSGAGPSPETAQRLFEPFVSDTPDGVGLGLFMARRIVEEHQGSITWRREDGMTCFSIELPLCSPIT